jgi:hypothetical protein
MFSSFVSNILFSASDLCFTQRESKLLGFWILGRGHLLGCEFFSLVGRVAC